MFTLPLCFEIRTSNAIDIQQRRCYNETIYWQFDSVNMFQGTHGYILVPFIILILKENLSFSCNLYDFLPFCSVFDCLCIYTRKVQNYLTSFSNNYLYNIFSLKFNVFVSMFYMYKHSATAYMQSNHIFHILYCLN